MVKFWTKKFDSPISLFATKTAIERQAKYFMVSSLLKARGNSHLGTCFWIITSWFSAPPYIATLAKALKIGKNKFSFKKLHFWQMFLKFCIKKIFQILMKKLKSPKVCLYWSIKQQVRCNENGLQRLRELFRGKTQLCSADSLHLWSQNIKFSRIRMNVTSHLLFKHFSL